MKLIKGELIKIRFKLSHKTGARYSDPFEVRIGEGMKDLSILNSYLKKSDQLSINVAKKDETKDEYLMDLKYSLKSGQVIVMEPVRYSIMDKYAGHATKILTNNFKSKLTVEVLH